MRAELENVYGPTECTCICSAHTVSAADFEDMQNLAPLGLPAQNFDFEILPLDEAAPDFGELFLRGPQVGLGYYNDPERTARSFIQNPNHSLYADIGYRTGDLVRRDARGWLHFKGRADFQIKHMGYRIALEEIEAHSEYCVMSKNVRLSTRNSATDLGKSPFAATNSPSSTGGAAAKLPPSCHLMIPRRVIVLDLLPKNANGKIDRVALQDAAASLCVP